MNKTIDKNGQELMIDYILGNMPEAKENSDLCQHLQYSINEKDSCTSGHCERVAWYCHLIGKARNISERELEVLTISALFHDVGKVLIPDEILKKPGELSDSEMTLMRNHSLFGMKIIQEMGRFSDCLPLILYHHERYDGKGYPYGLKGKSIPLLARIIAVADAYDAMTAGRRYKASLEETEAVNRLLLGKGSQFDPRVVDDFISIVHPSYNVLYVH